MLHANGRSKRFVSRVLGACDNCDLLELQKSTPKIADYKVFYGEIIGSKMAELCPARPPARGKYQTIDFDKSLHYARENSTKAR